MCPLEEICPQCIANGSAIKVGYCSFSGSVSDKMMQHDQKIEELYGKTPKVSSWNEFEWPDHCDDFCQYNGDKTVEEFRSENEIELINKFINWKPTIEDIVSIKMNYAVPSMVSVHKFFCLTCKKEILILDLG
jgi:uncharacterized protein CbrC (UPF0167 family)